MPGGPLAGYSSNMESEWTDGELQDSNNLKWTKKCERELVASRIQVLLGSQEGAL